MKALESAVYGVAISLSNAEDDPATGGSEGVASSATTESGSRPSVCLILLLEAVDPVDILRLELASSDMERRCPWSYGVKVDAIEVRSCIGGASFIVTRLGARVSRTVDDLREDIDVFVGDNSKNFARFARRLESTSGDFLATLAPPPLTLAFPNLFNDTS